MSSRKFPSNTADQSVTDIRSERVNQGDNKIHTLGGMNTSTTEQQNNNLQVNEIVWSYKFNQTSTTQHNKPQNTHANQLQTHVHHASHTYQRFLPSPCRSARAAFPVQPINVSHYHATEIHAYIHVHLPTQASRATMPQTPRSLYNYAFLLLCFKVISNGITKNFNSRILAFAQNKISPWTTKILPWTPNLPLFLCGPPRMSHGPRGSMWTPVENRCSRL